MLAALATIGLPLLLKALPFILAVGGAIAAFLGYGAHKKAQGRKEAFDKVEAVNATAQAEIASDKRRNQDMTDAELDAELLDKDRR